MLAATILACAVCLQVGDSSLGADAEQAQSSAGLTDAQLQEAVRGQLRILLSPRSAPADREAAEKALVELGTGVLDHLPSLSDDDPAELRLRLSRVRDKLQRQLADAAGKPSLVTLSGKMKLSKAIAAIQQQTGNPIIDYREEFGQEETDPELELDLKQVPFWQALDQIMDLAGLTVYGYPEETGVALITRTEGSESPRADRQVSYIGPFRIEAVRANSLKNYRSPDAGTLQLELETAWEPRVTPINVQFPLAEMTATDDRGASVQPRVAGTAGSEVVAGTFTTDVTIPLSLPDRAAQKIARLTGKLNALVPGRVEKFRFEDLQADGPRQEKSSAGATVTLARVRKNNDSWEFHVILGFDEAAGALESHRNWVSHNPCYLLDEEGNKVTPDLQNTIRQTENQVGFAYYFDLPDGPQGYNLVYETPAAILPLSVEFTIKDLPLP